MFHESLQRIVDNVEGGLAGILMGFDGIAVDSYNRADEVPADAAIDIDIDTVGMEFSFILGQVRKAAEALDVGNVQEVAIRADRLSVLIRVLNADYFLALAIREGGNYGKGRYLLRVVAPKLQAEL
jgi:predicted regulator of Ras-like GTPase activity (Roadblock/LC7/MglB family)